MKRFAIAISIFAAGYFFAGLMEPDYKCEDTTHIAASGDSLWSIAEKYCKGEITAAVDDMAKVYGTSISVTQAVDLP